MIENDTNSIKIDQISNYSNENKETENQVIESLEYNSNTKDIYKMKVKYNPNLKPILKNTGKVYPENDSKLKTLSFRNNIKEIKILNEKILNTSNDSDGIDIIDSNIHSENIYSMNIYNNNFNSNHLIFNEDQGILQIWEEKKSDSFIQVSICTQYILLLTIIIVSFISFIINGFNIYTIIFLSIFSMMVILLFLFSIQQRAYMLEFKQLLKLYNSNGVNCDFHQQDEKSGMNQIRSINDIISLSVMSFDLEKDENEFGEHGEINNEYLIFKCNDGSVYSVFKYEKEMSNLIIAIRDFIKKWKTHHEKVKFTEE